MIVVLHRERSEKLARELAGALREQRPEMDPRPDLDPEDKEGLVRAFDSLIQDGLIGEHEPRPEGRE